MALINKAKVLCKEKGYKGHIIQTEKVNPAQHLYKPEGLFWMKICRFFGRLNRTLIY